MYGNLFDWLDGREVSCTNFFTITTFSFIACIKIRKLIRGMENLAANKCKTFVHTINNNDGDFQYIKIPMEKFTEKSRIIKINNTDLDRNANKIDNLGTDTVVQSEI